MVVASYFSSKAAVSYIVAGLMWLKLRTFPAKLRHVFVMAGLMWLEFSTFLVVEKVSCWPIALRLGFGCARSVSFPRLLFVVLDFSSSVFFVLSLYFYQKLKIGIKFNILPKKV